VTDAQKLAAAEAELKKLRDAAELSNTVSNVMKSKLIRAEIAARRAVDVDAVEALVSQRISMSETGDMFATDATGAALVGTDPGHTMGLGEYLDQVARDRPALFEKAANGGSSASKRDNPWVEGPGFSVTKQMILLNTAPERAARLQTEAGVVFPDRA
jgi:hypothetical protein